MFSQNGFRLVASFLKVGWRGANSSKKIMTRIKKATSQNHENPNPRSVGEGVGTA